MVEYRNNRNNLENDEIGDNYNTEYYNNGRYECECCHCKKIFMFLVLLILVFIAGIMVGNCGRCRYADNFYYGQQQYARNNSMASKKYHRGMQEVAPAPTTTRGVNRAYPSNQMGGFIVEIDDVE